MRGRQDCGHGSRLPATEREPLRATEPPHALPKQAQSLWDSWRGSSVPTDETRGPLLPLLPSPASRSALSPSPPARWGGGLPLGGGDPLSHDW